jgi:hypothetical protein
MATEWTAGGAGASFEEIGDGVGGVITFMDIVDGMNFTQTEKTRQKVIDLQPKDGDSIRLYVKKGNMETELAAALRGHGLDAPRVGDSLAVTLVGTKPSKTKGYNPAKVYEVAYKVAATTAATGATSAADLI